MAEMPSRQAGALRIRVGVLLVVLSWVPFAQMTIWLTSASDGEADRIRYVIWGIQILVGFAGVGIAGKETIAMAKQVGWRRLPREAWRLLRSPDAT